VRYERKQGKIEKKQKVYIGMRFHLYIFLDSKIKKASLVCFAILIKCISLKH